MVATTSTSARDMETREPKAKRNQVPDNRSEKAIQSACVKVLKMLGFAVYSLSQARPSKQSRGLADLYCCGHGVCVWIEMKTRTGSQTLDQVKFQRAVDSNRGHYLVARSEADVIAWSKTVIRGAQ